MSDLITAEEAGKLLDEVAQNQPRVCLAWCLKSAEDCLCYKAKIAEGALYSAAPDLARTVIALHADRDRLQADYEERILSALEPAVQPDAAAIREEALRDAIAFAEGTIERTLASRAGDSRAFTIIKGFKALIDKSGKEEALGEMSRLGQEFDAAIFNDVESLYENGEPRKEVMPDVRHYQDTVHDTAPAGLSAGGGAGWQPIETAPKDRVVDLWSSKGFRYPDALWDVCWGEKCWTNPHNHVSIEEGGPYTHWRYPPEPPATEGI